MMTSQPAVAAANLTLTASVLGKDASEGVDLFNVIDERGLGVVQLGLEFAKGWCGWRFGVVGVLVRQTIVQVVRNLGKEADRKSTEGVVNVVDSTSPKNNNWSLAPVSQLFCSSPCNRPRI